MTPIRTTTLVLGAALALAAGLPGTGAHAVDKEYFSETYRFKKAHDGYTGFSGSYYCDYQKKPVTECSYKNGRRVCRKNGWELRQHCY